MFELTLCNAIFVDIERVIVRGGEREKGDVAVVGNKS